MPYSKKNIVGMKVSGKINRKDFGIANDTPNAIVGEQIAINTKAEFIKE